MTIAPLSLNWHNRQNIDSAVGTTWFSDLDWHSGAANNTFGNAQESPPFVFGAPQDMQFHNQYSSASTTQAPGLLAPVQQTPRAESLPPPSSSFSVAGHDDEIDGEDIQGIDWYSFGTSRTDQQLWRRDRLRSSSAYRRASALPNVFKPTDGEYQYIPTGFWSGGPEIQHVQLRQLICAASRRDVFLGSGLKVIHLDPMTGEKTVAMDLSEKHFYQSGQRPAPNVLVSCLTALDSTLVCGGVQGEFAILSEDSRSPGDYLHDRYGKPTVGLLSPGAKRHLANHVELGYARTGGNMRATFSSNDGKLSTLDCGTTQIVQEDNYGFAINHSATSPDGRLRLVVGDDASQILVIDADSGRLLTNIQEDGTTCSKLTGEVGPSGSRHTAGVLTCAWAPDGHTVATGAEDMTINIHDARMWSRPVVSLLSESSEPISLRFSPLGSGPSVLAAAEAEDVVNVIDCTTFQRKQLLHFCGAGGGAEFVDEGAGLYVAMCNEMYGGVAAFEQTWRSTRPRHWMEEDEEEYKHRHRQPGWRSRRSYPDMDNVYI